MLTCKDIERFDVTHDNQALRVMVVGFRKAGVTKVAIERGDGPVVQVLVDAGLAVFVVSSRQIKVRQTRYCSAGNKDDRLDSYVLADTDSVPWSGVLRIGEPSGS